MLEFKSQGSYAMRTMVRHPDNDYDIDDGTYFDAAVLIGSRGGEMTALQARCMVRDAVDKRVIQQSAGGTQKLRSDLLCRGLSR